MRHRRRQADRILAERARSIARSSIYPPGLRLRALGVWAVFALRVAIGWHSYPSRHLSFAWHGNYCGPGHTSEKAPRDALDAACAEHDARYGLPR